MRRRITMADADKIRKSGGSVIYKPVSKKTTKPAAKQNPQRAAKAI